LLIAKAVKLNKDLLTSFSRDKQVSTALVADFQSIFYSRVAESVSANTTDSKQNLPKAEE